MRKTIFLGACALYRRKFSNTTFLNQRGFGMVGLVVSMGLLGVFLLAIAGGINLSNKITQYSHTEHSMGEVGSLLSILLARKEVCNGMFPGDAGDFSTLSITKPLPSPRQVIGINNLVVGTNRVPFGAQIGGLTLLSKTLLIKEDLGANLYLGEIRLGYQRKSGMLGNYMPTVVRQVLLQTSATGDITGCASDESVTAGFQFQWGALRTLKDGKFTYYCPAGFNALDLLDDADGFHSTSEYNKNGECCTMFCGKNMTATWVSSPVGSNYQVAPTCPAGTVYTNLMRVKTMGSTGYTRSLSGGLNNGQLNAGAISSAGGVDFQGFCLSGITEAKWYPSQCPQGWSNTTIESDRAELPKRVWKAEKGEADHSGLYKLCVK